jgi:hypothetical protein
MSEEEILNLHSQRLEVHKERLISSYAKKIEKKANLSNEREQLLSTWAVICTFEAYGKDYRLFFKKDIEEFLRQERQSKALLGIIIEIYQRMLEMKSFEILNRLKIKESQYKAIRHQFKKQLLEDKSLDKKMKFVFSHFEKLRI